MTKKITAWIICLAMILTCMPAAAFADTADSAGTEKDPYIIKTEKDFDIIRNDLHGYYKLANDIEMTSDDWEPLGEDAKTAFYGVIDGDGHAIKGLNISCTADRIYSGFIGYNSGTVKNLDFEDCHVTCTVEKQGEYFHGIVSG